MRELFRKYVDNQCSEQEIEQLLEYFNNPESEIELRTLINESLSKEVGFSDESYEGISREVYRDLIKKVNSQQAKVVPLTSKAWFRAAAAVIIIFLVGGGAYFLLNNSGGKSLPNISKTQNTDVKAPISNLARITLADGRQVYLDSIGSGEVALQSNIKVVKLANGEIDYLSIDGKPLENIQYNTLHNPRGSLPITLKLSDGTKVWLNSESSLKYPVAFIGNKRSVEISGEAYFEVTRDEKKKFIVSVPGKSEVEVLGTHFNVNSYADEATINTTLLEGSVRVYNANSSNALILAPGQQAKVAPNGPVSIKYNPDIEEVMAWKEGRFIFGESMDIPAAMRQIARWYDLDISIEDKIPGHIGGSIQRNVNVSQVFKMIEKTGVLKFEIKGKSVIVRPGKST